MKKIISLILCLIMIALPLVSCNEDNSNKDTDETNSDDIEITSLYTKSEEKTNFVLIDVNDYGKIVVELYPDIAPITVANFQKLVSENFYDGITFHRIISGFMIQGGDPEGTGMGGSSETIKGEFALNDYDNTLKHERGVISMARGGSPYETYLNYYGYTMDQLPEEAVESIKAACNTASSQFFIVHQTSPHLDGNYAGFGKVVYGIEIVDKIAAVETDSNDKPLSDVVMNSVYFVTPNN